MFDLPALTRPFFRLRPVGLALRAVTLSRRLPEGEGSLSQFIHRFIDRRYSFDLDFVEDGQLMAVQVEL